MKHRFDTRAIITLMAVLLVITALLTSPVYADKTWKVKLTRDIQWVNGSEEYKLCARQAYMNAMNRLKELAKDEKPGTWCVVLDADETVISNLEFQKDLEARGVSYNDELWKEWGLKAKAEAVPGAKEFCKLVKELGGKVIIITNRKDPLREVTLKNLDDLGIPYDACILREGPYKDDKSKVERRNDVENGTIKGYWESKKLPPLKILMLAGDQKGDLYDSKKADYEDVKDRVVKDFIVIPNPMYGDWDFLKNSYIDTVGSPENVPIEVNVGEDFTIALDSNRTTGYSWSISKPLDNEVVTLVSNDYLIPKDDNRLGQGGLSVWKFKAIGAGKALITLEYKRSWEKGKPPADKKTYFLIVKEDKKK